MLPSAVGDLVEAESCNVRRARQLTCAILIEVLQSGLTGAAGVLGSWSVDPITGSFLSYVR